ncbi:thiotemplate mechanism natural product synthetase [Caballeronia udeis]|uniref:Thiotemplate mechanism natural product synthetase n=1 Tax=Caballeronia udeis TaxID=1232866 RepID=A0A158GLS8_9BURK|nr:SDR family NAD(P)-dependent oxidoreductase [Caballeronia udeis]SAL32903.1 thiotemplate mechanism natural product synthetase [Caballeronia udeis]
MNIKGDDVAIIGMSGKFPGADSVSAFWDNLCAGRDSIQTMSDDELRRNGVSEADIAGRNYVKVSATLNDVDRFDPGFFKISPLEAELMDPQIRLLLQCAWGTLEDAGYAGRGPQNVGVFAGGGGVATSYFANFVNLDDRFEKVTAGSTHLGNDKDFLATYVSYKLNLTGPSMTIQTACSTSIVALHQARLSLLNGECDMAMAGGVSVRVPHAQGYLYKDGYIFSKSGCVRPFDAGADGVVFGSGVGLVLIKRLSDAIRDGDNIHAVIKGSAISNDGKGKMSYAASSAKGQIACIGAALRNADVDAASIGFVEAHGTGTAMGDPEEVKALSAAFKEYTGEKGFCALGAVKANIGHLEAAAGIAGLIKAVLVVKHGIVPPAVNYKEPNPRIKFENTPFTIEPGLRRLAQGRTPRRAAVNSLGVGGTNAFIVIEQHAAAQSTRARRAAKPVIVPISAKSQASLRAYAERLADFLAEPAERIDLADVAYTLQSGREAMECRAAFVAEAVPELIALLRAYIESGETVFPEGELSKLAAAWVRAEVVEWPKLHALAKPKRVCLPTYVFAKERCWIEATPPAAGVLQLHPLLHANTSDLNEHRYSSTLSADAFFLRDHVVRVRPQEQGDAALDKVLPGVAALEMARAAIERAVPRPSEIRAFELRDIVWVQPIIVAAHKQVDIALVMDDADIEFEIYSDDSIIHCQGRGSWGDLPVQASVNVTALEMSMGLDQWEADSLYEAFAAMGLHYGPAHRAIQTLRRGEHELLARLALPAAARAGSEHFVLHPSLMDGALQAATALLVDMRQPPATAVVPFALDRVRVLSACTEEMFAWVRRTSQAEANDKFVKLDIDLCDVEGNVCVQIQGFTARAIGREQRGALLATELWKPAIASSVAAADVTRHVVLCALPDIDTQAFGCETTTLQVSEGNLAHRYAQLSMACFGILKIAIEDKPKHRTVVQFVLPSGEENLVFAGLSGLFKTAALENPMVVAQLVFTDERTDSAALAAHLIAESNQPHDVLIRYEDRVRYVAHWQLLQEESANPVAEGAAFKDHGVYLITGGLGGLGAVFAREILRRTEHARVILTGRAAPADIEGSEDKRAVLASLQSGGGTLEYRQLDLEDPDQVKQLVAGLISEHKQLNGIFHSAGMTADDFILKKTADAFSRVLAPKVLGTANLDEATREVDLDFLVLFSSLSSALGNLGQADYAAANGFMDHFATLRNRFVAAGQRFGRTLTIRWALWQDGGMQVSAKDRARLREETGIVPMSMATGLRMFYRSLASTCDQTLAMEGDVAAMQRALGLPDAEGAPSPKQALVVPAAQDVLAHMPAGDVASRTRDYLREQLAALLKLPANKVDPQAPLEDYGIDSILALDLTRALERAFGPLPKTLFFEYLSLAELADYFVKAHAPKLATLLANHEPAQASVQALASTSAASGASIRFRSVRANAQRGGDAARDSADADPIAIVGLSGRYPGAPTIDAYWEVLRDGKDSIIEVPKDRWDWREYYSEDRTIPGKHYSKWGGFIEGVDEFDARFFNISPPEAETLDPQERLFLQHAWMAIEDAGCTRAALQVPNPGDLPAQVGVYAGVMYGEYQLLGAEASLLGKPMGFASNPASIANRVSYFLNLHGPSMVVDTMCSSSLTAIHLACQDLKLGRTALAIAGGVNVTIHPNKYLMLSAGQFISSDGHCQSFGEGGGGYIPGEGVGVVVLKRLSDARRDGNQIYGLIRGSALSHGGKTNGYTVPNPQAQASAIRQALAEARVDPRHISYVEAHGTGTKLGDPIEIAALSKVFNEHTADTGFCLIGSAKSNIGHCEAAAGIAGLTKVLLQLKHRQIVPSLHSSRLNPHIDFDSTPFVVNQTLRAWDAPAIDGRTLTRMAGISSFGAGGANAHVIIEEYVPAPVAQATQRRGAVIVPLSARTAGQLEHKARDLLSMLRGPAPIPSLESIAHTLQVGREAMSERLSLVVDSENALIEKLQAFLNGQTDADGVYRGRLKPGPGAVPASGEAAAGELDLLAQQWVEGVELNWRKLHALATPIVSLPVYPFARQRHWIDVKALTRRGGKSVVSDALHPLLHRNVSDFNEQRYAAKFDGSEFFLSGSPGEQRLGAAACLEMARAAFEVSMPAKREFGVLELSEVAWALPGIVAARPSLSIALFDQRADRASFEIHGDDNAAHMVHCQGHVTYVGAPAPERLDLDAIRRALPSSLVELRMPAELADTTGDYVLHPALFGAAWEAAAASAGGAAQPVALRSARVVLAGTQPVLASVRPAPGKSASGEAVFDIDMCDAHGNVCVQLRGLRFQSLMSEHPVAHAAMVSGAAVLSAPAQSAPLGLAIDAPRQVVFGLSLLKKPNAVALRAPASSTAVAAPPATRGKPTMALGGVPSAAALPDERNAAASVELFSHGRGVFAIKIDERESGNVLTPHLIDQLLAAMRTVEAQPDAKVLMLSGADGSFLRGARQAHADAIEHKLYRVIAEFPYPVIAVMRGDALGAGFMVGALADFMVCAQSAHYGFTDLANGLSPAGVHAIFDERFGRACASDLLYLNPVSLGEQLQRKGWTCPVLPADEVDAYAHRLAADLAEKSQESLRLLKRHLARHIVREVQALVPDVAMPLVETSPGALAIEPSFHYLQVATHAQQAVVVTLRVHQRALDADALLGEFDELVRLINAQPACRCVILASDDPAFLPLHAGSRGAAHVALSLQRSLQAIACPTISVFDGDAMSLAWFVGLGSDVCVYNGDGKYACEGWLRDGAIAQAAPAVLARHFGDEAAKRMLMNGATFSGVELRRRSGAIQVFEPQEVMPGALRLAETLVSFPVEALADWTAGKRQAVPAPDDELAPGEAAEDVPAPENRKPIVLEFGVVTAISHADGILEVLMEDRDAKNMFSDAFSDGMREVFAHVEASHEYKVVVITGFGTYFSLGGTSETLLAIHEGRARFTDNQVFRLPLSCSVPVVAAMQGHGIGAGWALGMFADFAIFSEESRYYSPYMSYGFTPGAGATLIFPRTTGYDLARETLLTARDYSGTDLEERGLRQTVLPRNEVLAAAMDLARAIAQNERKRLVEIKRRWTEAQQLPLEETLALELAMHERTFVGQADTLARIQSRIGAQVAGPAQAVARPPVATPASVPQGNASVGLDAVAASLRQLLAHELRIPEHEIGDDEPFVSLGLDSITGVTWIRKINEIHATAIEAVKVYSYPTLIQLARHVLELTGASVADPLAPAVLPAVTLAEEAAPREAAVPAIAAHLRTLLAHELRMDEHEIGDTEQFVDLGLDSITGVTWIRKINETYGTSIEAIKVYSYPTLERLSGFVAQEAAKAGTLVGPSVVERAGQPVLQPVIQPATHTIVTPAVISLASWREPSRTKTAAAPRAASDDAIAVIGLAGQFPHAKDLDAFWRNLAEGRDCVDEVSRTRWDIDRHYQKGDAAPGKTYSKWMGALDEYDLFDPAFFNISPREARSMDPQQRLFLQACWNGIEHAGYDPKALAGSRCGVFVGSSASDYHQLSRREQLSGQGFTGAAPSILAARIAYFLDLHGPGLSIDTACSSSLVAIASACDSLLSGGSDLALAGGVNVLSGPSMHIMTSQLGMLSPDGRCSTFDDRANGIVLGEGVGVVVLKRFADAERDGDCIHGIVRGWGVNQDGKTNGITAPNAESQAQLQHEVYDRFCIDPAGIGLIEAHGTGTPLGDPIEVAGLKSSFQRYTERRAYCALGSVKSNIGHCLTAAGVSGFIKVLLALEHEQLPPTVHYKRLNRHIALENSPFYINDSLRTWPRNDDEPRRAAVNSFGFSGTNAHVVVEEHRDRMRRADEPPRAVLVPLSARSADQLMQKVHDLLAFLRARKGPALDLQRITYTLQVGREAMNERLAFIVASVDELIEKLQAVAGQAQTDGRVSVAGAYRGQVADKNDMPHALYADADFQTMVGKWLDQKAYPMLGELWSKGLRLDWTRLYTDGTPRRTALPAYPFAKERYWIDEADDVPHASAATLHPLVHVNTSNLSRQAYRTAFSGSEFFLHDESGRSSRQLPASVYLEMARAAVVDATPDSEAACALELRDVEWMPADGIGPLAIELAALRNGAVAFEVRDAQGGAVRCIGSATLLAGAAPVMLDLALLRQQLAPQGAPSVRHRAVREIFAGHQEQLLHLVVPESEAATLAQYVLHPSLLDGALQAAFALAAGTSATPLTTAMLDSLRVLLPCARDMFAWVRRGSNTHTIDIDLCDQDGRVCVCIKGFALRTAQATGVGQLSVSPAAIELPGPAAAGTGPREAGPVAGSPCIDLSPPTAASAPAISQEQLQRELKASLAEVLFMQPSDVSINKSFTELGLDSIIGVEWVSAINTQYGTDIAATRVYDYPSVKDLAAHLAAQISAAAPLDVAPVVQEQAMAVQPAPQPVRVVQAVTTSVPVISLEQLQRELKASLAEVLFMQPSDVSINKSFTELGLDSIIGVEWVNAINTQYGTDIGATRVYDYASVKDLAAYLAAQISAAEPGEVAAAVQEHHAVMPSVALTTPIPASVVAPRARAVSRFARDEAIRFAPKYDQHYKDLYFYSPDGEGDFEADGEFSVRYRFSPETNVCLQEHVVFGEHLLPTDTYVELVHSACRSYFDMQNICLSRISIVNPLLGNKGRDSHVKVVFRRNGDELQFFVKSSPTPGFENDKLHMQGFIALANASPRPALLRGFAVEKTLSGTEIPTNVGIYYAPLQTLSFGASAAHGDIRIREHGFTFLVSPFALYGGLCTVINYAAHLATKHYGVSDDQFLPHRIGELAVSGALDAREYRCYAEIRALERDAIEFYFEIVDAAGLAVLVVDTITLRRVGGTTIRQQAAAARSVVTDRPERARASRGVQEEKIAIIGMACRYPKSEDVTAFWENLKEGRDCVTEIPAERWADFGDWYHPDPRHPHTSYSKWAGMLERIDTFDPLFFGISPAEAELIEPQQRIFLEECWKTIESAGYAPGALSNTACGVYVGCASGDYVRVLNNENQDTAGAAFMGTSTAILAARISYYLNLKGAALAIDTACSSSLVAVHLACESIRCGDNELALAGGINLLATPIGHILTSQVGMPSHHGRCATFDAAADGIVFSEGCGVLLLKPLSKALEDNDRILGVISASGTNQDGRSNGITAPSSKAQEQLLGEIYGKFDIDPRRISLVEAHGTATPLGDPIEVGALNSVFRASGVGRDGCALGSVKSNIGHTGFAAGVAGMVKALLCIQHRKLVPSIHYQTPNPHIDFTSSPFTVNTEYRDWECGGPRVAAVSSFGFSGTNAHVVIEEYPCDETAEPRAHSAAPRNEVAVPLSARAGAQLKQQVANLLEFLRAAREPVDLQRLAHTLQVGRDAMEHRVGFVVNSVDELERTLQGYLDGKQRLDGAYRGATTRDDEALSVFADDEDMRRVIEQWFARANLHKLMNLWARGMDLDWSDLYRGERLRPLSLPTYPFAKESYWPRPGSGAPRAAIARAAAHLHPLLHRNTSDLSHQRYESRFDGSEFFLAAHQVKARPVLPAVVYLEMVRAAIEDALPAGHACQQLKLDHVAWAQSLVVTGPRRVAVVVFAETDGQIDFEVTSCVDDDGQDGQEILHCQGHGVPGPAAAVPPLDLPQLMQKMTRGRIDAAALYPRFAAMGLEYGPAFQGIVAIHQGGGELLVELRLPDAARQAQDYVLHPSLMDSALQGSIMLIAGDDAAGARPALPFALESLRIVSACTSDMFAWVRRTDRAAGASQELIKVDIDLCDCSGTVCVQMHGFSSRPMTAASVAADDGSQLLSIIERVLKDELSADEAVEMTRLDI